MKYENFHPFYKDNRQDIWQKARKFKHFCLPDRPIKLQYLSSSFLAIQMAFESLSDSVDSDGEHLHEVVALI